MENSESNYPLRAAALVAACTLKNEDAFDLIRNCKRIEEYLLGIIEEVIVNYSQAGQEIIIKYKESKDAESIKMNPSKCEQRLTEMHKVNEQKKNQS